MDDIALREGGAPGARAASGPGDRPQPALLDRLTDTEPRRRSEGAHAWTLDGERLRAAVLRDLSWLLNTRNAEDGWTDWSGLPHAQRSVINFGMRSFVGRQMSAVERMAVEASIRDAILRFEPRIVADSVEVRSVSDEGRAAAKPMRPNVLSFEITGLMWSNPRPIEFALRSSLDLETGAMSLLARHGT